MTEETISLVVWPDGVGETSHPQAVVSFLLPSTEFDANVIRSSGAFFAIAPRACRLATTAPPTATAP